MKCQDQKSMQHKKITPFISFKECSVLQIICHIKKPDRGTTASFETKNSK